MIFHSDMVYLINTFYFRSRHISRNSFMSLFKYQKQPSYYSDNYSQLSLNKQNILNFKVLSYRNQYLNQRAFRLHIGQFLNNYSNKVIIMCKTKVIFIIFTKLQINNIIDNMPFEEFPSSISNADQFQSSSINIINQKSQNMPEYVFQRDKLMINMNDSQIQNESQKELSSAKPHFEQKDNQYRIPQEQIKQYFGDLNVSQFSRTSYTNLFKSEFNAPVMEKYQIKMKSNSETKNIPKNYGKQLIKFVFKNEFLIKRILSKIHKSKTIFTYEQLCKQLHRRKHKLKSIEDLRSLWTQQNKFHTEMRIISNLFLRKFCHEWIFNSKIKDFACHIKYRNVLLDLIRSPDNFRQLKRNY